MITKKEFKLIKENGEERKAILELIESGAFKYGNEHAILLKIGEPNEENYEEQIFDARYDSRFNTKKTFNKHAYEFVRDYIRKDIEVIECS